MEKKEKRKYRERLLSEDEDSITEEDPPLLTGGEGTRFESHENFAFRPRFSTVTSDLSEDSRLEKGFKGKRPLETAHCCARLWFVWVLPILRIANKTKKLTPEVLGELREEDASYQQTRRLERSWKASKNGRNRLCRSVWRAFAKQYFIAALLGLACCLGEMVQPLLLYYLLRFLEEPGGSDEDFARGYLLAGGLMVAQLITALIQEHSQVFNIFLGRKITAGLIGLISEKSLRITPAAEKSFSSGEVVNRVQTDASKLSLLAQNFQYVIRLPLQLALCTILLFELIGSSFLAGVGVLIIATIYNLFLSKISFSYTQRFMTAADQRMNITTQALQNIKTLKFAAWESHFQGKIAAKRQIQMGFLRKRLMLTCLNISSFHIMPLIVCLASFGLYLGTGNVLSPSLTYTVILVFNLLKDPLKFVPVIISIILDCIIALRRIQEYLMQEEIDPLLRNAQPFDPFALALDIQNASFTWKMPPNQALKVSPRARTS